MSGWCVVDRGWVCGFAVCGGKVDVLSEVDEALWVVFEAVAALGFSLCQHFPGRLGCARSALSLVIVLVGVPFAGPPEVPMKRVMKRAISPCLLDNAPEDSLNEYRMPTYAPAGQLIRITYSGGPNQHSKRQREYGQVCDRPLSPPSPSHTP